MLPEPKSKEWHQARRSGIGGSDANIIMGGDPQKIHELLGRSRRVAVSRMTCQMSSASSLARTPSR